MVQVHILVLILLIVTSTHTSNCTHCILHGVTNFVVDDTATSDDDAGDDSDNADADVDLAMVIIQLGSDPKFLNFLRIVF